MCFFFFFKQKTAYEMRISDWSSDVCSSDLLIAHQPARFVLEARAADLAGTAAHQHDRLVPRLLKPAQQHDLYQAADMQRGRRRIEADEIGRASCRERVCQYV